MPRTCKECKYKLQYNSYCKDQELKKQMQKDKLEIVTEIKRSKFDYSGEPSEEMIKYYKTIKQKIENKNDTYRKILKCIHYIVLCLCLLMVFASMVYSIINKEWKMLLVALPFSCFLGASFIAIYKVKEKTEQDAYNSIMALISLTSLVLAVISMT